MNKCKHCQEPTRNKYFCSSRCYWNHPKSEEFRIQVSKQFKGKHRPEWLREHLRRTKKGVAPAIYNKEAWKSKLSKAMLGNSNSPKFHKAETRIKISISPKGSHHTQESLNKIIESRKVLWANPVYRQKVSAGMKRRWSQPGYKERVVPIVLRQNAIRPNNQEKKLGSLLEDISPGEWQYVGDGSLILGGLCPDFMNVNGQKKVIELFGDYWHRGQNPQKRIDYFAKFGFETLVIWEKELKGLGLVKAKLAEFAGARKS